MVHYILQMLAFQVLFLAVYDLFLKKETFHTLNRIYLLLTPILGIILPFIRLSYIQQNIPQEYIIKLPTVLIGDTISGAVSSGSSFWLPSLMDLWFLGMLFSLLFFSWKIFKIAKLKFSKNVERLPNFKLLKLPKTDAAFSFFDTIFLGENISEENRKSIIAHEKIHIQQKHTLDLLFFEMLRIVFWFNPLVYLFQNRMAALHEYIADDKVVIQNNKKEYYQNLLSQVFQTEQISFINTFFNHSLIKKRIIMLQKSKSRKILQLKYILLLPIICGMLAYTSCSGQVDSKNESTLSKKIADLRQEIQSKDSLSEEEKAELNKMIYNTIPENGNVAYKKLPNGGVVVTSKISDSDNSQEVGDVPFSVIEQVPTYPGCSGDNGTMKKCMSESISKFLNENFNTKLGNDSGLVGQQRISVQFKIDKTGKIVDVRARAKRPEFETEAVRVVSMLPQMKPGEHKGKKVGVLYSLPIVFEVK